MISICIGLAIIFFCILADQLTKAWAVIGLSSLASQKVWVIPKVFSFTLTYNPGAAFSSFEGQYWLLMGITLVATGVFVFLFRKVDFKNAKVFSIGISFMIGGMLGNLVDRTYAHFAPEKLEGVIDFLSFDLIHFAIFNVADSFLVIGIILFIIDYLFLESRRAKNGKSLYRRK